MQHLWAPWRMGYIRGPKEEGCFFCRKTQENKDAANYVLVRDCTCFAMLNSFPYSPGHLMVAPYKHTGEMDDLSEQELADLMLLTRRCRQLLTRVVQPHGFNIGFNLGAVAGAGVLDHLHLHIVPRWQGDTNFMPVVSDTKVLPQALDEIYQLLKTGLDHVA
jgi:ATP adenylyltransferase